MAKNILHAEDNLKLELWMHEHIISIAEQIAIETSTLQKGKS